MEDVYRLTRVYSVHRPGFGVRLSHRPYPHSNSLVTGKENNGTGSSFGTVSSTGRDHVTLPDPTVSTRDEVGDEGSKGPLDTGRLDDTTLLDERRPIIIE